MNANAKDISSVAIARHSSLLQELSSYIWQNPETAYEEHLAHAYLTEVLLREGFDVKCHYPLPTSFVASFGTRGSGGLEVGICCEYDALPGMGHGCGHNLIAECSIGAALGIKEALCGIDDAKHKVVVFGTPAEENSGGKIHMIKAGVFESIDLCMMAHPFTHDVLSPNMLAVETLRFDFKGACSVQPQVYHNPVDAAVSFYNNVSLLRQQMKPTWRIHGIFTDGGSPTVTYPNSSSLEFMLRAPTDCERSALKQKVLGCADGAAVASGCPVRVTSVNMPYSAMKNNKVLVELLRNNLGLLGLKVSDVDVSHGSTDMGNVSQVVPSIHPKFKIPSDFPTHSKGFAAAASSVAAQVPTLRVAKAMAMTALDCMLDSHQAELVKQAF